MPEVGGSIPKDVVKDRSLLKSYLDPKDVPLASSLHPHHMQECWPAIEILSAEGNRFVEQKNE
jgi:hypothetical protein